MRIGWMIGVMLLLATSVPGAAEVIMSDTFAKSPDRTWIGRDWWANRLQDWAIEDGRLICVEARPARSVRTAHWITRYLADGRTGLRLSVDIEPADAGKRAGAKAFAGFLIGAGGDHVDHRLTAQVHHQPAEDGGLLAVMDGDGIVSIRQFDVTGEVPGSWSIARKVELEAMPMLEPQTRDGSGFGEGPAPKVRLVAFLKDGRLVVTATDPETDRVYSRAEVDNLPERYLDGGIALVSHRGPTDRGRGFAFENLSTVGDGIRHSFDRELGPVISAMYTIDDGVLKMTAQLPPLGPDDNQDAVLEIKRDGTWQAVGNGALDPDSRTITFRVDDWDDGTAVPYRVVYVEKRLEEAAGWPHRYQGVIRAAPDPDEMVLAALNCQKVYTGDLKWNHDGLWMPHVETVQGVESHDPDLVFFAGDQIYEGDLTPVDARTTDTGLLDYLYKWYRFCWSFRDLARTRPTITIPDDHDVYHGNIWGAGGKKAARTEDLSAQDSGGYKKSARFVNAVHRTQVGHLPDTAHPGPIERGITAYYTDLDWGGVSFAILGDRMFKSSPAVAVPAGQFRNGWPQAEGFDPVTEADVEGAELLGPHQEAFLDEWAVDWDEDDWAKAVLSQTLFCNVATLPEGARNGGVIPGLPVPAPGDYPTGYRVVADGDSNGWPQSGRNRAVESMRRGGAIHVCGDQHLGSTVQYGVDRHRDAGWAFCVPAISNTWPRRWFPPEPGGNHKDGDPRYTGDYRDGFGNLMTVRAVANPVQSGRQPSNLYDRMPGWGIIRFQRPERRIVMECWPRWTRPGDPDSEQYPGWPVRFKVYEGYGDQRTAYPVAVIECDESIEPLLRVRHSDTGEIESVRRIRSGYPLRTRDVGPWDLEASIDGVEWTTLGTREWGPKHRGELRSLRYEPGTPPSR